MRERDEPVAAPFRQRPSGRKSRDGFRQCGGARNGIAQSELAPPRVTVKTRQAYTPAAPLPAALTPVTREKLLGRWVPVDGPTGAGQPPFLEFIADGRWRGSDGCNGQSGRWVAGQDGALLGTTGLSTLIGCDNVPISGWIGQARRAGFDHHVTKPVDPQELLDKLVFPR